MKLEVNGIHINYEISGKEGAKVVVLSHSLSSSMIMWEPQLEVLEPHFQVLRYDMRGHGQSDAPEGAYTLEQLAGDVIGLLDALGLKTVHFVGLSIGGMIGQCLGLNHADRLDRLVLCDTTAVIPTEARQLFVEREQAAREKGMAALVQGTLERWFTPGYLQENPPVVDKIRDQVLATPMAGYTGCSQAILGLNYLDRLSEIHLPTLIMVGEDDPGTPVSASEAMHERIPGSRLEVLPHAAHLSNIEQAQTFNAHLMGFLREA
ncbi:MAG: 3-oxoadipate enol-lactonase [Desulfatiglandaceae bacterium]